MLRGHLTQSERYQVDALREAGHSLRTIGERLGRAASTICRELHRNGCAAGYVPDRAHLRATYQRQQASMRPRISTSCWLLIEALLRKDHSLQQIAGSTELASHERIYQHIAADHRRGGVLYKPLRHSKPRRHRRCLPDRLGAIKHWRDITTRPLLVDTRERIGDWKIDTMVKANGGEVRVTMTERRSRLHLVRKATRRTADGCAMLSSAPCIRFATWSTPSPRTTAKSSPTTSWSASPARPTSTSPSRTLLGNVAAMKTPTGWSASTYPKAPTSPLSVTSKLLRLSAGSTADQGKR